MCLNPEQIRGGTTISDFVRIAHRLPARFGCCVGPPKPLGFIPKASARSIPRYPLALAKLQHPIGPTIIWNLDQVLGGITGCVVCASLELAFRETSPAEPRSATPRQWEVLGAVLVPRCLEIRMRHLARINQHVIVGVARFLELQHIKVPSAMQMPKPV